jgi:hypothetical protein
MRKEIPRVMIGDRHRQPVYPCPVVEIAEHRFEPFVMKIGGKREQRCLHSKEIICSEIQDQIVTLAQRVRATGGTGRRKLGSAMILRRPRMITSSRLPRPASTTLGGERVW